MSIRPSRRNLSTPQLFVAAAVLLLAGLGQTSAYGQALAIWDGGTGNWTNFSNWSCFCVPNGNYDVNIGTYTGTGDLNGTVTLNTPASVQLVALGVGAVGTLDVSSKANSLTTGTLYVGNSAPGNGTLNISGGGVVNDTGGEVGVLAGSAGNVTVSGSGSQWNNSTGLGLPLIIGDYGRGTLTINDGGVVVGNGNDIYIAQFAGSTGNVTVSGKGSQLNSNIGIAVGAISGAGTLSVENGAVVSSYGDYITVVSGTGSATVTGVGSEWNDVNLTVGTNMGQGTLTIEAGGIVNTQDAEVGIFGFESGGTGTVTVNGSGSQFNVGKSGCCGALQVGSGDRGILTIENGGTVTSVFGNVSNPGAGSSGNALVTGTGSAWLSGSYMQVSEGGSLTVQNGGLVQASTIAIEPDGTVVAKTGTLIGNVFDDGTFDPLGTATVDGTFTLNSDGTLSLDAAGTGAGQLGVLDVSGMGAFDGTLAIDFIDGFAPLKGETFDFIDDAGGVTFDLASIDILGLKPGFDYSTNFANGEFTLTALNNGQSTAPEPSALVLLGSGLGVLGWLVRRRQHATTGSTR